MCGPTRGPFQGLSGPKRRDFCLQSANCAVVAIVSPPLMMHCYSSTVSSSLLPASLLPSIPPPLLLHTVSTSILKHEPSSTTYWLKEADNTTAHLHKETVHLNAQVWHLAVHACRLPASVKQCGEESCSTDGAQKQPRCGHVFVIIKHVKFFK